MSVMMNILMSTTQQAQGNGDSPSALVSLIPFVLIFVVFYFLFIRPQTKRQKEHQQMMSSLKKGDRVMTSGGLIGTIVGVGDETVTVRFGDNFKTEVGKSYISGKVDENG